MSNTFLYVVAVAIWGSTWLAIEFQLGVVAPEVSIVYRYALASLLLFIWCKYRKLSLVFDVRSHLWFGALGLLLFSLNYILAYHAQVHITSALAAIAFSMMLWMNIVLSRVFFGTRATPRVMVGAALGIVGIVIIFAPQVEVVSFRDSMLYGCILAVAGALTASCGNMASQAAQKRSLPVLQANAWGMLYGALITAVVAVAGGHPFTFDATFTYIASLVYLAVFGSVIAFGAYLTLVGRIGAHRAGYAAVLWPVVSLALSMAFEGLRLDAPIVIGTSFVLLGNLLVLKRGA